VASDAERRWWRVVDQVVPPRGDPRSVERFRGRAAAVMLGVAALLAFGSLPADLLAGLWLTTLLGAALGLVTLGLIAWLRAGAGVAQAHRAYSAALSLYLLASAACEQAEDMSAVAWTCIIPLSALVLMGFWPGLRATLTALGVAFAIIALHPLGVEARVQAPVSLLMATGRYVVLLLGMVGLAASQELLREHARRQADRAARVRQLFLANVSHELRTPMNGVLGLTELVLGTELHPEQREQLELAHRSGQHLVALIDDMLDLTRFESGGFQLEVLPVDVRSFVDDLLAVHRPTAQRRGLRLEAVVRPAVPRVCLLDPTRTRQVLTNLVGNALKFTPAGSVTLEVSVRGDPLELAFAVRDTGIGIAPEARARLFKPFSQLDQSHTRRFGGTGLGLALSAQLARAMRGSLGVDSGPGVGAVFTLAFPCQATELTPEALAPTPVRFSVSGLHQLPTPPLGAEPPAPVARPVRALALVVDDNPINLRVARGMVERLGYPVDTASNGLEALEKVRGGDYLFVLMDCHMPELDGYQATLAVRALGTPQARVKVLALTASVLPEDVAACTAAGMDGCLAKPLNLPALRSALERVLPAHAPPPAGGA
jgi:signal transduction histidine kinase/CheY-like chemotaxis protein